MLSLLVALVAAPWAHPLAFQATTGWTTGKRGNTRSVYVGHNQWAKEPLESAAWMARGVRYRDPATADPPNRTLAKLPQDGVVVWAVISRSRSPKAKPIRLDFGRVKRFACCDAIRVPAEYELTGSGLQHAYSVIVRIYFGAKPSRTMRAEA